MTTTFRKVQTSEDNIRSRYDVEVDGVVIGWVKCYDSDGSWVWSGKTINQTAAATRGYAAAQLINNIKEA